MEVFEVAIGAAEAAGNFRVEVVESPDGAMVSAVVALDADGLAEAVLASRVAARPLAHDESPVRPVGRTLFRALLGNADVGQRYRAALAVAAVHGVRLRIVLRIADPRLSAQPLWVPRTSSTSRDQAILVDQTTGASLPSDAVLLKIDRFGQRFQRCRRAGRR